jgi:hypothetical protein
MRSPAVGIAVLFAALAGGLVGGGCGSDENMRLQPDPKVCSGNWRVLFTPDQALEAPFDLTGDPVMRTHGDRVFVNPGALGRAPAGVRSLPMSGGSDSIVFDGWARAFWIEDDQVLAVSSSALQRRPLAGGDVETLVALDSLNVIDAINSPWELDRQALYWATDDFVTSTIWRAPRDGGAQQPLVVLPPNDETSDPHVNLLQLLDDGRLVAESGNGVSGGHIFTIPKTGGALRDLKVVDSMMSPIGIAPDGTMLWIQYAGGAGNLPRDSLVKQRVDEETPSAPLMTYDALSVAPMKAVPDGNGGFYVMALEYGTDGGIHTTVWAIDAGDHMSRIACDPEIGRFMGGAAGTPDALYAVVEDSKLNWQVVAISRTP